MGLLDEVNFWDTMHDAIDRECRDTKPDQHMVREQCYLQHKLLDKIVDTLRLNSGK